MTAEPPADLPALERFIEVVSGSAELFAGMAEFTDRLLIPRSRRPMSSNGVRLERDRASAICAFAELAREAFGIEIEPSKAIEAGSSLVDVIGLVRDELRLQSEGRLNPM